MDRLLTAQEVSVLLKMELTTVYKWTSQGRIPHVKLSARAIRFSKAAIMEWLQSKTCDGAREEPTRNYRGRKRKRAATVALHDDLERIISSAKIEVLGNK
jgi:excisionase family DNA binding protein